MSFELVIFRRTVPSLSTLRLKCDLKLSAAPKYPVCKMQPHEELPCRDAAKARKQSKTVFRVWQPTGASQDVESEANLLLC